MKYSIGLDIGITSVGFAIMELDEDDIPCRIATMGSRIFDAPENPKDGASLALPRREARGIRRCTRRRRHRKKRIKNLIVSQSLLSKEELNSLYAGENPDVYKLRVDALDGLLTNNELARVLIHLAQRRGFKSNRKNEAEPKDSKGLLKALEVNADELSKYRTVGEMLYNRESKRNKPEDYSNTVLRSDVLKEAHMIFEKQRSLGNNICDEKFENNYYDILSSQRSFDEGPGGDSPYKVDFYKYMVGDCTLEGEKEKRAAKATYSFEYFNLLQKINHIRLETSGQSRALFADEQRIIINKAHDSPSKITAVSLRKLLSLPEDAEVNFRDYTPLKAFHEMRKALKSVTDIKYINTALRNQIGHIFTYEKTDENIETALKKTSLNFGEINALIKNIKNIKNFKGNGHLSLIALDKLIPHLEKGFTYYDACKEAGYNLKSNEDATPKKLIELKHLAKKTENTITSPVARRALSQCAKVINAIIREIGTSPVYINIELAREMSNNFDERMKTDKDMKENQAKNERIKEKIKEYGINNPTGLDIVKMKLYEEQSGICPYSLIQMDISQLFDPGYADIDHIMPYSESFDDSYKNKILVRTEENRQKGDRLPLHYLKGEKQDKFIVWVNNSHLTKNKKQNLLCEKIPEGFKERNLQDTKTISSFMYNYLTNNLTFADFSTDRKRHVMAVNGAVTSMLRKRWGLNKIREDGDLHHALDAAVIACVTQGNISMLTKLEKYYIKKENYYIDRKTGEAVEKDFPQPYDYGNKRSFSNEIAARLSNNPQKTLRELNYPTYSYYTLEKINPVFVSRMPNRKVSGAAHKETIKGIGENNSQIKKVPLSALKLDKNGEIDGYYNPNDDRLLYNALKERLAEFGGKGEKAFDEPFYKPKSNGTPGPIVKKVKIEEKSTLNVLVHDKTGSADNGSMIRVDVFYVNGDGYYLVPIYVADVVKGKLPNKAIIANKSYVDWKEMSDDDFIFSLYPNDLVYIEHKKGLTFSRVNDKSSLPQKLDKKSEYVYYKKTGISTGSITIINHDNSYFIPSLGVKSLLKFEKWQVDVLGNKTKVVHEPRLGFDKEG
ncbi:MAG: type II CRISPR RNA-guided endonuclease Cas9 [Oscillospiraceae bacterium]|jgi:CRISPR-associated endonuclease Csn1|nr:type II CRISPR RNA-guided endonuclease Cas9 [Oscillospiraceae bacterium]